MNCPSCSEPLLFGATGCDCGYSVSQSTTSPIDLSYREALSAFWRVYWPSQLFGIVGLFPITGGFLKFGDRTYRLALANPEMDQFLIQAGLGTIALFVFVHRIFSRPYNAFTITLVELRQDAAAKRVTLHQRFSIWFFLWWRQIVAGILVFFLAGPLNMFIGVIGLRSVYGLDPRFLVSVFATALGVGPILMKMLVSHQFSGFRFEVKRPS